MLQAFSHASQIMLSWGIALDALTVMEKAEVSDNDFYTGWLENGGVVVLLVYIESNHYHMIKV